MGPHFTVGTPRLVGTACNRGHVERNKVHSIRDTKCEEEKEKTGSRGSANKPRELRYARIGNRVWSGSLHNVGTGFFNQHLYYAIIATNPARGNVTTAGRWVPRLMGKSCQALSTILLTTTDTIKEEWTYQRVGICTHLFRSSQLFNLIYCRIHSGLFFIQFHIS